MRRILQRSAATGVATFFFGVIAASHAHAQGLPCDPVIYDDAGVFDNVVRLQQAASALEQRGAIVRIRAVRTFGDLGSLDHLQKAIRLQCPSWQATNGENRDALIAIFLAVDDHEFAVYTGGRWADINDRNGDAIQLKVGGTYFRREPGDQRPPDFVGGFVAAMEEFGRLIDAGRPSIRGTPMHGLGGGAGVIGTTTTAPSAESGDGRLGGSGRGVTVSGGASGSGNIGWAFLALLAFALFVLAIVLIHQSRQRRRAAHQKAKDKRHAANALLMELRGQLRALGIRTEAATLTVSEADAGRLRGKFQEIERLFGTAAVTINEVEPEGSQDPTRDGRTREEYETVAAGYERALVQLREANDKRVTHDAELEELHRAGQEAPKAIEAAEAAIGQAVGAVEKARGGGWKVEDASAKLETARNAYIQANADQEGKRLAAAKHGADVARAAADEAKAMVDHLAVRKAKIETDLGQLEVRISDMERRIETGRQTFERISERYAESSWDDIAGNGSQAEAALEEMRKALVEGRTAATMEQQCWADAEADVLWGSDASGRADALLAAIASLEERLKTAERSARPEIDAAATDLERAAAYEHQHDADVDDAMKAEIATARTTLERARVALAEAKPDFLEVVRLAKEANSHADRILAKCQSEVEAAERLWQKATSVFRDAEAAVAKAGSYISSHSHDVQSIASSGYRTASASLSRARLMHDPQTKLADAQHAKREADEAYQQARRDVDARQRAADDGLGDAVAFVAGVAIGQATAPRGRVAHVDVGGHRAPSAPSRPAPTPSRSSGHATSFGGGGGGGSAPRSSGRATKW